MGSVGGISSSLPEGLRDILGDVDAGDVRDLAEASADVPGLGIPYMALVLWDVIVANIQVAKIVLFMPSDQIRSAFITVPIDLDSPEAITLLAGTITMTPGTLTADIASDGKSLLIHSLHAPDPDAVRDDIKTRYEARLKRIFG